jgi:hypothetical protein
MCLFRCGPKPGSLAALYAASLTLCLLLISCPLVVAQKQSPPAAKSRNPALRRSTPASAVLKSSDVIATVEGQPITRRQLTYYWVRVDKRVPAQLGSLLMDRWRADKGATHAYTITEADIYRQLYTHPDPALSDVLSSLITNRLVAIEAARKGIRVTPAEGWARAHELFDQFRQQRGVKNTDAELMAQFQLPRDVFLEDMLYRVRSEKLLAADMAQRHEPPVAPDAWKQVAETRMPAFLAELRKKAKVTSTIPLPSVESPPAPQPNPKTQ